MRARYLNEKKTCLEFFCIGCNEMHRVPVFGNGWSFDGDIDRPTLRPSILVRSGHYSERHKEGDVCWCTFKDSKGERSVFSCVRCHSFVTDGKIEYLGDCSHQMAGQTVELPNYFYENNS